MTIYLEDVYDACTDPQFDGMSAVAWMVVIAEAEKAGKKYARPKTVPSTVGVFSLDSANAIPVADITELRSRDAEPEKPAKTLTEAVMAYLSDPVRSERQLVFSRLCATGFFDKSNDEDRLNSLRALLADYDGSCPVGADRARNFLKELGWDTAPTAKRVRVTLDVFVNDPNDDITSGHEDAGVAHELVHFLNTCSLYTLGDISIAAPIVCVEYEVNPSEE